MGIKLRERRGWAAMLYPSGVSDLVGALRGSPRLHWTPQAAREEAQGWIEAMRIGPVTWGAIDDQVFIGRSPTHVIVIRSILLPNGKPPPKARGDDTDATTGSKLA